MNVFSQSKELEQWLKHGEDFRNGSKRHRTRNRQLDADSNDEGSENVERRKKLVRGGERAPLERALVPPNIVRATCDGFFQDLEF